MLGAMAGLTRRQFHRLAVGSACALLGSDCGATVDGTVTPAMGQAVLPFAQFPALATVGGSSVVGVSGSFPLVVVRTGAATATALSATCPHAGCLLVYERAVGDLRCPCHNARFAIDGVVQSGPTPISLPVYRATVGSDAIIVDLS
jgi:nitrite reductase/ring-hydroxylating ferredoxin subunit